MKAEDFSGRMSGIVVTKERIAFWRGILRRAISMDTVESVRIAEKGSFSFDTNRGLYRFSWLGTIGGVVLYFFLTWINLEGIELSEGARTWMRYSTYASPASALVLILLLSVSKGPQFSVCVEITQGSVTIDKTSYKERAEQLHQSIEAAMEARCGEASDK